MKRSISVLILSSISLAAFAVTIPGYENTGIGTIKQYSQIKTWVVNQAYDTSNLPPRETYWKESYLEPERYMGKMVLYKENIEALDDEASHKPFQEHYITPEHYMIIDHEKKMVMINYQGIHMPFIETSSRSFLQVPVATIIEDAQENKTLKEIDNGFSLERHFLANNTAQMVKFRFNKDQQLIFGDDGQTVVKFNWTTDPDSDFDYAQMMEMEMIQQEQIKVVQQEIVHEIEFNQELPNRVFDEKYPEDYKVVDVRELLETYNMDSPILEPGTSKD